MEFYLWETWAETRKQCSRCLKWPISSIFQVFTGNFDLDSVVLNSLENAVEARYIRLRPKEWHNGIAVRVEVYGSNPLAGTKRQQKEVRRRH